MSEHRRAVTRPAATQVTRRRRLLVGAVGALGASGLIVGGAVIPVSAGDVNAGGNPYASVDVQDGCVTAAAGTGGADGSVAPQHGDGVTLDASGQGTATATICPGDLDGPSPDDPGGSLPDDPGDIVSDELDEVVPDDPGGWLEGEVIGAVSAALDDMAPGDGEGPLPGDLPDGLDDIAPGDGGGSLPGDPGDVPGGPGALLPDGSGIDVGDLFDRLGEIITEAGDGGGPGGNDGNGRNGGNSGGAPAVNTSTNGSVSVEGADAGRGDPTDVYPGSEIGAGVPALVGTSASPGGTLPRTGGGLGSGVLRLFAFLGLGRGLVGLAKRR